MPVRLQIWLDKMDEGATERGWDAIEREVDEWMDERELVMAVVLTSYVDESEKSVKKGERGKSARELMAHVRDDRLKALYSELEKDQTLQLERWRGGEVKNGGDKRRVWHPGSSLFSRMASRADRADRRSVCR